MIAGGKRAVQFFHPWWLFLLLFCAADKRVERHKQISSGKNPNIFPLTNQNSPPFRQNRQISSKINGYL
jgi:hypothetical protein